MKDSIDLKSRQIMMTIAVMGDAMQKEGIIDYEQAWEFRMRARMKGADDE